MSEDQKFQELFARYQPPLSDSEAFMRQCSARLEAAALLREMLAQQRRAHRRMLVVAFVLGLVVCAILQGMQVFSLPTLSVLSAVPVLSSLFSILLPTLLVLLCVVAVMALCSAIMDVRDTQQLQRLRQKFNF